MLAEAILTAMILLITFALIVTRAIRAAISAYAIQSWLLGGLALALFAQSGFIELLLFGLLTIVIKGVAVPRILRRRTNDAVAGKREVAYFVRFPTALLLGAGLTLIGFIAATRIPFTLQLLPESALGIGVAVLLLGLFTTTARRDAILQVAGLLAAENGLLLIGLVLAPRLSLLIEFAIVLDILIAVLVMGFLVARMHEEVSSTDTSELTRLRG
jgi:hydrogenase-4 component E